LTAFFNENLITVCCPWPEGDMVCHHALTAVLLYRLARLEERGGKTCLMQ